MKIKNTLVCLTAILSSVSSVALADHAEIPAAYRVGPLEVREVVPTPEELYSDFVAPDTAAAPALEIQGIDWGQVILIGKQVIEIIKEGKPVVNVRRDAVAAVPAGVRAWEELNGWQAPRTKVYSVTAKNYLGMTVVDLRLKVSANWGGGMNGKGKYLANVIVVPSSIYVLWGFQCDVWTENREPVNSGTKADPVAGLGFDVRFKYGNALNMQEGTQDYFVKGDGTIQENP